MQPDPQLIRYLYFTPSDVPDLSVTHTKISPHKSPLIKLIQFNVRHYYNNRHFAVDLTGKEHPDIVLKSTCITNTFKIKHHG